MSFFSSRKARLSDYEELIPLCKRAVGPGDYALHYLGEVIKGGGLFLAIHDQRIVCMTNFERCIDGSGWLGMARTDPDWRGKGVALFLQQQIAKLARREGIRTLRLWTSADNVPAIKACRRGGFRPVCETAHVSSILRASQKQRASRPVTFLPKTLEKSILFSDYSAKMNGYAAHGWHLVKMDSPVLRKVARRRELYVVDEIAFLLTMPEYARWNRRLHSEFTLLSGSLERALRAVKEASKAIGVSVIGSYLPCDVDLVGTAKEFGFRVDPWASHCIVFEKKLM